MVIALIAHDAKKHELAKWAQAQHAWLMGKRLVATRSTARVVTESTGLPVDSVESGPLGGDQQIGALVSTGQVTCLVFFWDPLGVHPHAHDVYALLRLATLYDVPTATNPATTHALADSRFPSRMPQPGRLQNHDDPVTGPGSRRERLGTYRTTHP
ncbi:MULTISPECIES: methylglyoxal synthase [Streptomyces]|uniref:methylglyoxal synthase n=1 Tax=Streptomyces TaxID=1883 RepID=UPI0022B59E77|nr:MULTISPECIES: methylglyoxal synthase [Streptomyces]MCZ4508731.1 methylglyoxal synthase [Streptomyces sp. ActVer]